MDVVLLDCLQGLSSVIGGKGVVALGPEVDVQGRDNVLIVVADQNVIHARHIPWVL